MLVSLPLAGYILLLLAFRTRGSGWRGAAIHAATVWGVLVVVIIELLSLPHWLTTGGLSTAWFIIDIAAAIALWYAARHRKPQNSAMEMRTALCQMVTRLGKANIGLLAGAGIVVALVGAVALLSPPNTWDAMEYHMPRVVHWIQNRSVAFYPTHELRQLHMPPLAEFTILHLHALFGGDRLDNLVQWFSLLGSVVGVTLIAQSMGAGYRGQVLAAIICVTIPEGILQASGAKNDYVLAFWLVALAYYLLAFTREPNVANTVGMGSALGLAWLTKGSAYVLTPPLLIAWALAWPWSIKVAWLKRLPLLVLLTIGLNLGHFARNYGLYGSPLGPGAEGPPTAFKYTNDTITAPTLLSNILRNMALHAGTPSHVANRVLERWVEKIVSAVGGNVNDPHTTWDFTTFRIPETSTHEALAGNPIHLMLIVVTLMMLIGWGRLRKSSDVAFYTLGLVGAFVLLCALFKWQPWHTRLHLPLFVLWSAAASVILTQAWPHVVTIGLGVLLLLLVGPTVVNNQLRPLAFGGEWNILNQDRVALYFADRRDLTESYVAATEFAKRQGCRDIGLDLSAEWYEYPLLVLLHAENGDKNVRNVGVKNRSAVRREVGESFKPCVVICPNCVTAQEKMETYAAAVGPPSLFQHVVVFGGDPPVRMN